MRFHARARAGMLRGQPGGRVNGTLVAADQSWILWGVLLAAAAAGVHAERTRLGAKVSGAVVTMGITFALSNLRVIPSGGTAVYDTVWSALVPLAIPLLLFQADLRRIVREAGPTLIAFLIGGVGTVLGTLLAFQVVPLGEQGWRLAAIFCATYVGGSMNYAAAAEAVGLREGDLLSAGVAADNLVMAAYFLVLFTLPGVAWLRSRYPRRDHGAVAGRDGEHEVPAASSLPALLPALTALALSTGLCAFGFGVAELAGWTGAGILVLTAATVVLATAAPRVMARLDGAEVIGALLMQIFFAVIGASANVVVVLRYGPLLVVFAALILLVHLTVLLLAGRWLKLDLVELVIASNANMGGPTTAAAMAAARGWRALVLPAVLCGTLGYAIATFVGVAIGQVLR